MSDVPPLWDSGARKEAMELLRSLWSHGEAELREALSDAICAGPAAALLAHLEEDERQSSRDRRIFDRLAGDPAGWAAPFNRGTRTRERPPAAVIPKVGGPRRRATSFLYVDRDTTRTGYALQRE